ncbi:larval cuticle protein A2B-like [Anthonomus grandis grandis]|uniref:larval cuticle protein A2B-like n=1 Tax=Anthonomus grandis grandis TaxID=2921223 RepID=UPI0021657121|nr:larval cuticle protein A2B-like [Anthonomus grandis grandis]
MAFKFIAFATLLAYAQAGNLLHAAAPAVAYSAPLAYSAPVAKAVVAAPAEEYDPNPQYSYGYDVQDGLTGDSKSQSETRNGDVVQGSYSLVEPDGTRRIVEYTADPHNGFNAVVHKEPAAVAVKTVAHAPVVAAAPSHTIAKFAAPVASYAHSAPVAYAAQSAYAHPAPVAYAAHAAPVAYAAQSAYAHPAPVAYAAAPSVAKYAYSSPAVAYHH